jgi:CheY-like chemotaxis protein
MANETSLNKGKILLMDDEEMILEIGSEMLEFLGYDAIPARNGIEAIECYASAISAGSPFQAVIMDLNIPGGMGAKDTLEKLKAIDPEVRAMVSSGHPNDPVVENFRKYGFSGAIPKPYRMDDLKKALQEL